MLLQLLHSGRTLPFEVGRARCHTRPQFDNDVQLPFAVLAKHCPQSHTDPRHCRTDMPGKACDMLARSLQRLHLAKHPEHGTSTCTVSNLVPDKSIPVHYRNCHLAHHLRFLFQALSAPAI